MGDIVVTLVGCSWWKSRSCARVADASNAPPTATICPQLHQFTWAAAARLIQPCCFVFNLAGLVIRPCWFCCLRWRRLLAPDSRVGRSGVDVDAIVLMLMRAWVSNPGVSCVSSRCSAHEACVMIDKLNGQQQQQQQQARANLGPSPICARTNRTFAPTHCFRIFSRHFFTLATLLQRVSGGGGGN